MPDPIYDPIYDDPIYEILMPDPLYLDLTLSILTLSI